MSTITEMLGIDHLADKSIQEALGTMTVSDLVAAVLGTLNLQSDKFIDFLKPTRDKVDALLDNATGLVTDLRQRGIKALL